MIEIIIDNETYNKIKAISDVEDKDFSQVISEALEGKTITF